MVAIKGQKVFNIWWHLDATTPCSPYILLCICNFIRYGLGFDKVLGFGALGNVFVQRLVPSRCHCAPLSIL